MNAGEAIAGILITSGIGTVLAERLALYGEVVLEFNRTTNLTAARDPAAFADQIMDSLTLASDVDGPLIDIGSGAGLPGIPLAIATGQPVLLIESVKKKSAFLAQTLRKLGLAGEALDARAEVIGRDPAFREQYAYATARAVAISPTVAELTLPFVAVGGKALLQRGNLEAAERQAVTDAALMLGAELIEERLLLGDRRVLVLLKNSPTQLRFPRREGIPEKRPLCVP